MNHEKQSNQEDAEYSLKSKWVHRANTAKKVSNAIQKGQSTKKKNPQFQSSEARSRTKSIKSPNTTTHMHLPQSRNRNDIDQDIIRKITEFGTLTRCIKVYCSEELKQGRKPWKHVVRLVEAFNKSQLAEVSPQVQRLVGRIIQTLNQTHNKVQKEGKKAHSQQHGKLSHEKGRVIRQVLSFQNRDSLRHYDPSQNFSFSPSRQQQQEEEMDSRNLEISVTVKRNVLKEIQQLEKSLEVLREQQEKFRQARLVSIRLTKYERWMEINKLRKVIESQKSDIDEFDLRIYNRSQQPSEDL